MSVLDDKIARAGPGAVLMASYEALEDIRANTSPTDWTNYGYRGARLEMHDEWSWGWMVRRADGSYVGEADA